MYYFVFYIFFFKQKTAYEWRISDWSSDVCSSDLHDVRQGRHQAGAANVRRSRRCARPQGLHRRRGRLLLVARRQTDLDAVQQFDGGVLLQQRRLQEGRRSEEHTSELQSLMRISYAVFCLKKKTNNNTHN